MDELNESWQLHWKQCRNHHPQIGTMQNSWWLNLWLSISRPLFSTKACSSASPRPVANDCLKWKQCRNHEPQRETMQESWCKLSFPKSSQLNSTTVCQWPPSGRSSVQKSSPTNRNNADILVTELMIFKIAPALFYDGLIIRLSQANHELFAWNENNAEIMTCKFE